MNFFGIGGGEVVLVLVVALIIWGPKRLPEIARTLGKTMNMLKKSTYDLTSQLTRELDTENTRDKEKEKAVPSPPEKKPEVKPEKS
jgi:Tat protein translocase TatB subunit